MKELEALNIDGSYQIKELEDGFYIFVIPPIGRGKTPDAISIKEELEDFGIGEVDISLIEKALMCPRQLIKIKEKPKQIFELKISEDRMKVFLIPKAQDLIDRDKYVKDVKSALINKGIDKNLIREENILSCLSRLEKNKEILLLEGKLPFSGKSSEIIYNATEVLSSSLAKGQIILVKSKIIPKEDGLDVFSNKIEPKEPPPQDIVFIPGRGVNISKDGCILYATSSGNITIRRNKNYIRVDIDKELNYKTRLTKESKISFFQASLKLPDIEGVEGLKIIGDLYVENKIVDAEIEVEGNIYCKEIRTSKLKAEVILTGQIIDSEVFAEKLIVVDNKATISGGCLRVNSLIVTKILGSKRKKKITDVYLLSKSAAIYTKLIYPNVKLRAYNYFYKLKNATKNLYIKIEEGSIKTSSFQLLPQEECTDFAFPTKPYQKQNILPEELFLLIKTNTQELASQKASKILKLPQTEIKILPYKEDIFLVYRKGYNPPAFVEDESFSIKTQLEELAKEKIIQVEVSEDGMRGYITITPPKTGGLFLTVDDVISALREKNIIYGIKTEIIKDVLTNRLYNRKVEVAKGEDPTPGTPPYIHFYINPKPILSPKIIQEQHKRYDRVDFRELGLINNVRENQLIAEKHEAKPGKKGMNIFGKEIPPPKIPDVAIKAGKGCYLSDDGRFLYSKIAGCVKLEDGKVVVEPVYEVDGNVDFSVGNINFIGDVIIKGDVLDNFKIYAGGDIIIKGNVGKSYLYAEGNIYIEGGINGRFGGRIVSKKSLYAKYIENSYVRVGENLVVSESILHTKVESENGVYIVAGRQGRILGGEIIATFCVEAKDIGSDAEVKTQIKVGFAPNIREKITNLYKRILEYKKMIYSTNREILREKIKELFEELNNLKLLLKPKENSYISSLRHTYPGVVLSIGNCTLHTQNLYTRVKFILEEGRIKAINL